MLIPDRRRRMLELVRRSGSARAAALAAELGVSAWTVRRDLAEMERQGLLTRARGGALVEVDPRTAQPAVAPPSDDPAAAAKARIGAAAAQRVVDDTTVMVLAGSTTSALLPHLHQRRLTVVTNGIETAYALRNAPEVSVVVVGGYLHRDQMTLLGPMTERAMADLHVDLIVAGAYGVHADVGVTGHKIIQAGYHHSMLQHTDGLMVLADSGKLDRRGPTLLARLDEVDTLVTDQAAGAGVVDQLRARGPEVVIA